MKKLLASAAFVAMAIAAGGAMAAESTVAVTATSSSSCSVTGSTAAALGDVAPGGTVNTAGNAITFGTAGCNAPAKLKVASTEGGLAKDGTGCSGAASSTCIVYGISATWNGGTAAVTTAGTAISSTEVSSTSYSSTAVSATLTPVNSGHVVDAGTYSDTLTLTVVPQ